MFYNNYSLFSHHYNNITAQEKGATSSEGKVYMCPLPQPYVKFKNIFPWL